MGILYYGHTGARRGYCWTVFRTLYWPAWGLEFNAQFASPGLPISRFSELRASSVGLYGWSLELDNSWGGGLVVGGGGGISHSTSSEPKPVRGYRGIQDPSFGSTLGPEVRKTRAVLSIPDEGHGVI